MLQGLGLAFKTGGVGTEVLLHRVRQRLRQLADCRRAAHQVFGADDGFAAQASRVFGWHRNSVVPKRFSDGLAPERDDVAILGGWG